MDDLSRLLARAGAGDEICLAAWIRRSQAEVWRLCAHLVDPAAADDLTQETYVRAWRALSSFRGESSARTWLLAIARRACADVVRARTHRRRLITAVAATTTHNHAGVPAGEQAVPRLRPGRRRRRSPHDTDTNNGSDDQLVGVSTDIAETAELDQTTTYDGSMAMQQVYGIDIPAARRSCSPVHST